jgi:hypothetical protein
MGIDIRQATPNDASAACILLRRSIEEGCVPDHDGRPEILRPGSATRRRRTSLNWFSSSSNYAIVAERERAANWPGLALLTQAGKLALCYVHPDAAQRRRRALLAAIEDRRAPGTSASCTCTPGIEQPFFERHGYVNAGKDKACFGLECDFLMEAPMDACAVPADKRFCKCSQ